MNSLIASGNTKVLIGTPQRQYQRSSSFLRLNDLFLIKYKFKIFFNVITSSLSIISMFCSKNISSIIFIYRHLCTKLHNMKLIEYNKYTVCMYANKRNSDEQETL